MDGRMRGNGAGSEPSPRYRFGDIRVEPAAARVFRGSELLPLEPKAFDVLVFLIRNQGRLVEKQELLDAVWQRSAVTENAMTRVVAQLRKLLGDNAREAQYIETVPTRGYRFIAEVVEEPGESAPATVVESSPKRSRRVLVYFAGIGVGALGLVAMMLGSRRPAVEEVSPARAARHASLPLNGPVLHATWGPLMTLSPAGDRLVFVGRESGSPRGQLYVRDMHANSLSPIPATEDATVPVFNADGRTVAYKTDRGVHVVDLDGTGPPETLYTTDVPWSHKTMLSWLEPGRLALIELRATRLTIRSLGRNTKPTSFVDMPLPPGEHPNWVDLLPGGNGLLLSTKTGYDPSDFQVRYIELGEGTSRTLATGYRGHLLPTGHLAYVINDKLLAVPFDADRIEVTGPPSLLLDGLLTDADFGATQLAYSRDGLLAYLPPVVNRDLSLAWFERSGETTSMATGSFRYANPILAPDGAIVAFRDMSSMAARSLWLMEVESGAARRVPIEGNPVSFVFQPHAQGVYFAGNHEGVYNVYHAPLSGARAPVRLTRSEDRHFPKSVTKDGRLLVFERENGFGEERDIWLMELPAGRGAGDREPTASPLVATEHDDREPSLSPDGRFVVYQSNATGQNEIYIKSIRSDSSWQVSTDGGRQPVFTRNGTEVVYMNGPLVMSVSVRGELEPEIGRPVMLFEADIFDPGYRSYDVTADGEKLVGVRADGLAPFEAVELVFDWPSKITSGPESDSIDTDTRRRDRRRTAGGAR